MWQFHDYGIKNFFKIRLQTCVVRGFEMNVSIFKSEICIFALVYLFPCSEIAAKLRKVTANFAKLITYIAIY